MQSSAIPRAADIPSKNVVQTVDGQKIVRVCDARLAYGDVVGDESLSGRMMSAGPILGLIDRFAGALAENVTVDQVGRRGDPHWTVVDGHSDERLPLRFGPSQVCRSSRRICNVRGNRLRDFASPTWFAQACASNGSEPNYVSRHEEVAKQRKELAARWRDMQQEVDELPHVSADMIHHFRSNHSELVPVQDTLLEVQTTFLPKNLNDNNTVFGGDVLAFMDKVVLQCARGFTRNRNMTTVSMNRVSFKLPIHIHDIVTMLARVCSVREYHLEVEVEVFISHVRSKDLRRSHTG
ncbi:hypothetical protein PF005_g10982 [Phytophthora fragariae]|uniref:HotDog ACOT-type domain-containing protein n=1 Tax=Phytophthora fragariae TaxID=53985 RepID=A0A6A3Y0N0_9STRA|nr:hypothetical protein PF007_g10219 [Phytophthora fragariae]KAE9121917.1 hypothetical protein PF010_g6917 [Phytophthora fragariae]KAE9211490.1 hypothetical protein PF005_g10982 [Phytophthora fragariae]KAE9236051.1 hypothetical protein PF002_g11348 [Phytophthora fragariae]